MNYEESRKWSDSFTKEVFNILNSEEVIKYTSEPVKRVVRRATVDEDKNHNTDLVVEFQRVTKLKIETRVLSKNFKNITIRATTKYAGYDKENRKMKDTEFRTEIQKLLENGEPDFFLFLWSINKRDVDEYMLVRGGEELASLLKPPYPEYEIGMKKDIFYKLNNDKVTGFVGVSFQFLKKNGFILVNKRPPPNYDKYWKNAFN